MSDDTMKMEERVISVTAEETRQWILALQSVTGGGTPKKETREDWQRFRWAMMQNLQRISDAWKMLQYEVENERERILYKHCGYKERFDEYTAEMKRSFGPFSKYLLPTGGYELPKGDIQRRFNEIEKKMTTKYADVNAAGNEFAARQQSLFAGKMDITMICCDYSEVPDDVNCAYLDFLSKILIGMPSIRFYHPMLKRRARYDMEYQAALVAQIAACINSAGHEKTAPETALDIVKSVFVGAEIA